MLRVNNFSGEIFNFLGFVCVKIVSYFVVSRWSLQKKSPITWKVLCNYFFSIKNNTPITLLKHAFCHYLCNYSGIPSFADHHVAHLQKFKHFMLKKPHKWSLFLTSFIVNKLTSHIHNMLIFVMVQTTNMFRGFINKSSNFCEMLRSCSAHFSKDKY